MLSDVRDSLESEIVYYASDYNRAEYARSTRWPEIETALTVFEAAVRADQIEKDAAQLERVLATENRDEWSRGVEWALSHGLAAIRAQRRG